MQALRVGLTATLGLGFTTQALALSCDEIMNMVSVNVPSSIIVQTMEGSGTQFTADDIRCLSEKGAPPDIIDSARKLAAKVEEEEETTPVVPVIDTPEGEGDKGNKFENTTGIGSDLPEATTGDEESEAKGPKKIEDLIKLYRAKKVLTASKGLYDLLEENAFPDEESRIHYYLAKCLYDLSMYNSSQHYFMQVVRKGPKNPYFKYALPKLVAIAKLTGNDAELLRVVSKIPPEAFPRQAKNHLYYLMGRKLYEDGELSNAVKYFELISSKSDLYLRSKYFEGVINSERGKLKSAVKDFRDVYQSEAAPENPKDLEELEELKDLALINIARVYYKIEKFENADNYYSQVDRDSKYWAESLFERAWTAFLRKDSNLTLGLLLTVRSPYYSDQEYIPEGTILRALTLYELCEFKDSERILLDFEGKYQPVREEIKAFVAEYESEEGQKLADRAFDTYFHGDKTDSQLQKNLFLKILRNRDMASVVKTLDMMDEEEARIDEQKGVWRDTVGNHLKKAIDEDRERYKRRGGLVLLKTLANENHKLGDLMQQSQIIRFEIVDAQRAEFERKMTNPDVGTIEGPPIDFAVSKQIIYWPFNGEFWQDELGYYRYTEKGSCNR